MGFGIVIFSLVFEDELLQGVGGGRREGLNIMFWQLVVDLGTGF